MAASVECSIVSAEESIFSGPVEMLVATGAEGDLGIKPGHSQLISGLNPGPVRVIHNGGEEEVYYVSGGFLEVQPNNIKVLADTAIRAENLDEAAAKEAKNQAEKALANQHGEFDYSQAAAQLSQAVAQLRTVRRKLGMR
ncbi:F0F1 ATP synthase subunit epsilon [Sansalvadorimonas verongulae]|uniref:F0F1 ATP synthase subunit epsilon n=1 Tax=Sansalvadorimonas verongulae TaxID=2172824 RepID=UPI0012BCE2B2|nr:F0F1 ATP synthase subunit epsilon [Sansalvadorimonas verongulae]MTI12192.1 F0F1 ATP synthase subunit epsilon [Sansalvadorimonas verongulae]